MKDANGQPIAHVYFEDVIQRAETIEGGRLCDVAFTLAQDIIRALTRRQPTSPFMARRHSLAAAVGRPRTGLGSLSSLHQPRRRRIDA